ncbi:MULTISPECIES: DUF2291 family protein [Sinorhizobium]|uniref:Lipoprotein n=2 Tax=Sinorhizobium TaxID=28105 RepID=A0A2S3YTK2_9HYPH|nr:MULTISPECIES: DUF2291 family protein [Sinorhizobium]AUX80552.1 hypothetical protein NXT3_PC01400 [Sinorhizobium fredii]PDT37543.1 hypothetical protein CO656_24430 [Sinorhizobium sp. FG01]POH34958.1 hypothetical protein ATY31_05270 [Sinorhizobium americanum]
MPSTRGASVIFLAVMMALAGCKIIRTPTAEETAQSASGGFDPDRMVAEIWDSKVVPYLDRKAGPFSEVASLAASDADAAGAKYGHKEKQGSSPWTFAARLSGTIIKAETKSRSAYVEVDADGDGKADARVQIGPAIRGTAIRDSLDFVNFNEFKNQIEWAQYGKAFNTHVNGLVLEKLTRDQLVGRKLEAIGAYPQPAKGQLPSFVPAQLTVSG